MSVTSLGTANGSVSTSRGWIMSVMEDPSGEHMLIGLRTTSRKHSAREPTRCQRGTKLALGVSVCEPSGKLMTDARISPAVDAPGDGFHPTVSVVTVNYNGHRYLERFLESLFSIDYPSPCYRVVLVDNASTDGSTKLVRDKFPDVHIVRAGENLGFAGGCNLGIRASRSEYVALVNNDTVVDRSWLRRLVEVAESDARIGLVGSKMLFLTPFLDLGLEAVPDPVQPVAPGTAILYLHEARALGCDYDKLMLRAGRISTSGDDKGRPVHALASSVRLAVPVAPADVPTTLILTLRAAPPWKDVTLRVFARNIEIDRVEVTQDLLSLQFELSPELIAHIAREMINNAGTRIDGEGVFGDRGIWEFDDGQYDKVSDVPALCGASVLLRRAMLERLGGFDTRFFMYFEDVDLSWRASRDGWRLVYTPLSQLHHVHSGSSEEGSPFWVFYVTRNHLFWLIKNGTRGAAARALGAFYMKALRAAGRMLLRRQTSLSLNDAVDLQVARSLTLHLPG